jgi:hypothetical protein
LEQKPICQQKFKGIVKKKQKNFYLHAFYRICFSSLSSSIFNV